MPGLCPASKPLRTSLTRAATASPSCISLPPTSSKSQQPPTEKMLESNQTNTERTANGEVLTSLNLFQYLSLSYCETVLSHLSLSRKLPRLLLLVMTSGCRLSTCRKHQAARTSTPDICKERIPRAGKFEGTQVRPFRPSRPSPTSACGATSSAQTHPARPAVRGGERRQ